MPVTFWLAALRRDVGTVRGNIQSSSGTQVCRGKLLNLVITLVIVLLWFVHKGHVRGRRGGALRKGLQTEMYASVVRRITLKQLLVFLDNGESQADIYGGCSGTEGFQRTQKKKKKERKKC